MIECRPMPYNLTSAPLPAPCSSRLYVEFAIVMKLLSFVAFVILASSVVVGRAEGPKAGDDAAQAKPADAAAKAKGPSRPRCRAARLPSPCLRRLRGGRAAAARANEGQLSVHASHRATKPISSRDPRFSIGKRSRCSIPISIRNSPTCWR